MSELHARAQEGSFPDLRIVAIDDLLLHEEVDMDRVARLIDRLSADGLLKNPPIVASLPGSERFMLLDGANRVSALENLEVPHVLVQVERFDDPQLELHAWNHVVRDIELETVVAKAHELDGVRFEEGRWPPSPEHEDHLCSFVFGPERALHLYGTADLSRRARNLCELTRLYYRGPGIMDRISHLDFDTVRSHYVHVGAVVAFPQLSKQDVRELAEQAARLPSGLTRFLVPRRVLGFNLRIAVLKSHLPLVEKQHWLDEEIALKVSEKHVRYYHEPTFIFDE